MKSIRFVLLSLIMFVFCYCNTQGEDAKYPVQASDEPNTIILFVDDKFTPEQETMIYNATEAWEQASSDKIKIIPYFKKPRPGNLEKFFHHTYKENYIFIWNIFPNDLNKDMSNRFAIFAGLWDVNGNVLIFTKDNSRFYNVVLHEIGHVLGLEHFNDHYSTVMHHAAASSCITDIDAKLLCEIYRCLPNPECTAIYYSK